MSPWTEDAIESAVDLWKQGRSSGEVSKALNVVFSDRTFTRSAVIGKLHRLGFVGDGRPSQSMARKVTAKREQVAPPPKLFGKVAARAAQAKPEPESAITAEDRAHAFSDRPGSISWDDLRSGDHRCRWPLDGQDGSARYCATDVTDLTTSYCTFHNRLSFSRGTPSERLADQVSGAAA